MTMIYRTTNQLKLASDGQSFNVALKCQLRSVIGNDCPDHKSNEQILSKSTVAYHEDGLPIAASQKL
jgi:hypothetical protein